MDVDVLVRERADAILDGATRRVAAARLARYGAEGEGEIRRRLQALLGVVTECVGTRRADPVVAHAETIARERFEAAYDLLEVQTAIHALEESIWAEVVERVPPAELARALGLVTTALGIVKDVLARRWVEMAGAGRPASLDLRALFEGTDGE